MDCSPFRGKAVLVIDDEYPFAQLAQKILQTSGFEARVALSGPLGIESARTHPPDLVLLDLVLPGMDGLGILRALRSDPRTVQIPVLLWSITRAAFPVEMAQALGARGFLRKPVGRRALAEAVLDALASDDKKI